MKSKTKILALFLLPSLVLNTTLVNAKSVELVEPQAIIYCMGTTSGYHEGVAGGSSCKFWDESVFPNIMRYVVGCEGLGYTEWICRGCGDKMYTDSRGHYIDGSAVHTLKHNYLDYWCVQPAYVRSSIAGWLTGYMSRVTGIVEAE